MVALWLINVNENKIAVDFDHSKLLHGAYKLKKK